MLVVLLALAGTRAMPAIVARAQAVAARAGTLATGTATSMTATATPLTDALAIDWPRRLRWLLLAAIPSGLLSAVTNFIATDLVSAPLLWVVPLAIYLASFIVAFSPRGGRLVRLAVLAAPAMVTLLWVPYGTAGAWPILALLVIELGRVRDRRRRPPRPPRPGPAGPEPPDRVLPDHVRGWCAGLRLRRPDRAAGLPERLGVPDPAGRRAGRAGGGRPGGDRSPGEPGRAFGLDLSPFVRGFRGRVGPYLDRRRGS